MATVGASQRRRLQTEHQTIRAHIERLGAVADSLARLDSAQPTRPLMPRITPAAAPGSSTS
jgi:hypothetical protein